MEFPARALIAPARASRQPVRDAHKASIPSGWARASQRRSRNLFAATSETLSALGLRSLDFADFEPIIRIVTYCLGIITKDGLVMASDSRTNAGYDQVNTCKKMHTFVVPGERVFITISSGSLSCSHSI